MYDKIVVAAVPMKGCPWKKVYFMSDGTSKWDIKGMLKTFLGVQRQPQGTSYHRLGTDTAIKEFCRANAYFDMQPNHIAFVDGETRITIPGSKKFSWELYQDLCDQVEEIRIEDRKYTDAELLDFLQALLDLRLYTGKAVCRMSTHGKGFRLHETSGDWDGHEGVTSVRQAITEFVGRVLDGEHEGAVFGLKAFIGSDTVRHILQPG